jgi:hypothetical protein
VRPANLALECRLLSIGIHSLEVRVSGATKLAVRAMCVYTS